VIINPPAFAQLPWAIQPTAPIPPSSQVAALADQAFREVDAYLLGIQPNLLKIPEGPQFRNDAANLRQAILELRQAAATGYAPGAAAQALRRAGAIHQRLLDRTLRVSRGQVGPNNARVYAIGSILDQIRPLIPYS
jgi:hypothetical protein